jgi:hypothetical protein
MDANAIIQSVLTDLKECDCENLSGGRETCPMQQPAYIPAKFQIHPVWGLGPYGLFLLPTHIIRLDIPVQHSALNPAFTDWQRPVEPPELGVEPGYGRGALGGIRDGSGFRWP